MAIALFVTSVVSAGPDPSPAPPAANVASLAVAHQALRRHLPNLRLDQLRRSAAPGLLQIDTPEGVAYATADGRYLINGDLIDTATRENLTERRRRQQRRTSLATLEAGSTIDFDPEKSRHAIVVFTDVDCGYCRKFHQQVGELNRHGITVRYAAFPRTGPSGATWRKMQAVWCAADRQKALSRAKRGEPVSRPENCAAPSVGAQYALGTRLGLKGTPLIVLEDGRIINGYLSTEKLLGLLETASIGSAR